MVTYLNKDKWFKAIWQSLAIFIFSAFIGLSVNLLRPQGLPVVFKGQNNSVSKNEAQLDITIEEALKFFSQNKAIFIDARSKEGG